MDKEGKTTDFLLAAPRDKAAAMRFFARAVQTNGVPEKVAIDKSGANKAAIEAINIVEQDHRAIKRVTRPMLNFKSSQAAKFELQGYR